jgi:hypothetical protein
MTQPQADLFVLYRAGLKSAADLMKASLESAERLQNQQIVAINELSRTVSFWSDFWMSATTPPNAAKGAEEAKRAKA